MRESLKRSIANTPVKGFDRYAAGSIVICNACARPVFKLARGISLGDKCGQTASAFVPLSTSDLIDLGTRDDVDAGVRAWIRSLSSNDLRAHVSVLREMKAGDPMLCPSCHDCFVQVISVDETEAIDRSYTVELVTIPPKGIGRPAPIRGKRLSASGDWIH